MLGVVMGLAFIASGAYLFLVGHKAADGTLRLNQLGGIRNSSTLASQARWDAGHKAAANALQVSGAVPIFGGVVMAAFSLTGAALVAAAAVTMLGVMVAVGVAAVQAQQAADALADDALTDDAGMDGS